MFSYPHHWGAKARATYNLLIGKKEKRKFWLITKDMAIRVDVSDKYIKDFTHATLSMLSWNASAKEQKPLLPVAKEATPYQPAINSVPAVEIINSKMTPEYIGATPGLPQRTNLFKHLLPTTDLDPLTLGSNLEMT